MEQKDIDYITKRYGEVLPRDNSLDSGFYRLTRIDKILDERKITLEERRCLEKMAKNEWHIVCQSMPLQC